MKNLRNSFLFVLLAGQLLFQDVIAQVTVTGSTGADGNYTSLTNVGGAFAAINATAQTGNNIVITITGNSTSEAGTNSLNAGAWTSITLFPTTTGLIISGAVAGPLINFNSADKVTIDGRVNATGTSRDLTITNTNTGTSASTIQFIASSENCTVKYCTIKGSATSATRGVIFFSTAGTGNGNDNNTIENNNLTADPAGRPVNMIFSKASSSVTINNNITVLNNDFYNHFNPGLASNGIHSEIYSLGWTISGNNFYETNSFIPTADVEYCAIRNTWGDNLISGNFIGGSSVACGGTAFTKTNARNNVFVAIYHGAGTAGIQGNTIRNFNWSNSGAASWTGVQADATANIGTTSGNTIGSTTGTGSITLTGGATGSIFYGINITTSSSVNCQNNSIGSVTTVNSPANSSSIYGIHKGNLIGSTNISFNTIGSSSTANSINASSASTGNAQSVIGIFTEGSNVVTVSNNAIANLTNGTTNSNTTTTGIVNGIASSAGNPGSFSNNTIHDLTIANANNSSTHTASVCGIALYNTWGGRTVNDNTIYNLSNTNPSFSGTITGIYYVGGPVQADLARNFIHGFSVPAGSTSAIFCGVKYLSGLTNVYNNIISLGGNTATTIYGLHFSGTSSLTLYFNTINIFGSVNSGTANQSMALYCDNNLNSRDIRNNILSNTRSTTGGSGLHYAAYFNYSSPGTLTMDYNDYYASGTGGALCSYNGADVNSLPLISGYDTNSVSMDPLFANAGGTNAIDYKPSSGELVGTPISSYTTDYAGTTRKDPPTMGAYETVLDLFVDIYESGVFKYSYARLKEAFNDINNGTYTGALELRIKDNISEKSTAILYQSGYTGAGGLSNYTSVNIYPTVSGLTITGNMLAPLIDLDGADNVTIDGRLNATGTSNDLAIIATNTNSAAATLRLINSAGNNTIKYCNLKGSCRNNSGGIVLFSTASSGNGNDGNTIDNCNLTNAGGNRPWNMIYSAGTSGRENSGNTISNNNMYDFFPDNPGGTGIYVGAFSTDWTLSGNSFYETGTIVNTGNNEFRFISVNNTSGNNFVISGNYCGGQTPQCGGFPFELSNDNSGYQGSMEAIYLNVGTAVASSVQGNTIKNISVSNTPHNRPFYGIRIDGGAVNVGTVSGNIIGASTGTGSITIATRENAGSESYGIYTQSVNNINISGNSIGSITTSNTVSDVQYEHSFFGIVLRGTGSTKTATNNLIGSLTEPMSIQTSSDQTQFAQLLYGIFGDNNATYIITGNTISNLHNNASLATYNSKTIGIIFDEGTATIQNNTIRNISNNCGQTGDNEVASVIGICSASPRSGTHSVSGNTLSNLTNTTTTNAAVHVYGILHNGSGNIGASGNLIDRLGISSANASSSALINGIRLIQGDNPVSNNIVNLSDVTNDCVIYGIYDNGGSGHNSLIYFNTVYIGGNVISGSANTAAFIRNLNNSSTNCRDNIFLNERSGGTGNHYSIYIPATIGNITLNYNDYFSNGTYWGYFNGTNYNGMAAWRTATTEDANSLNLDPVLFNPGGPSAEDYYPSATLNGIAITGYGTDYFGTSRATPPEMGALEKLAFVTWTGSTGSNWNTSTNWSPNTVPTETSWVIIPDVANDPVINDADMKCYNIVIRNGATLTINPGKNLISHGNFNVKR